MYYHQTLLSQDDFDDDDDGVLYRHVDPRSSLTLAAAAAAVSTRQHAASRLSHSQRRARAASPVRGGSRWDEDSGVSAFAPSQPPPTSLFALPSRSAHQSHRRREQEEEENVDEDMDREVGMGIGMEREQKEERKDWDEDNADLDTATAADARYQRQQHHHRDRRTADISRTSLPRRPALFSSAAHQPTAVSPPPHAHGGEDDSKWNAADEATAQLLQRAKVRQEQSDEDFFWSDPVVVKEEGAQRTSGGKVHATLTAVPLTERQKKERTYALKLQSQQHKAKRANHTVKQSNLATLSARRQARTAATATPLDQSDRQPASLSAHHSAFSAQLEADLSFKRHTDKLDIEDADAPSPISEEALAAGRVMAAEREQKSWRDQLDAQLDQSVAHPSVTAHTHQPHSHSRRNKKRGGFEEQLERVLRMRHSLHARYTSEQERLRRASQPVDDGLAADAHGCVRAVVVKLVASVQHYSLQFTVGILCTPYHVAESDGFAPPPTVQHLQSALPSLARVARALRVDVGRLALVVFNGQQRAAMHVPDRLVTPVYVRLTWPWFDVGERMGVFGHVLLDMFDCCVIDAQHGAQYERQEAQRWEAEREQREAEARRQLDVAENDARDERGVVVVDDAELRKQQDAMREAFGDLTQAEYEALAADDDDTNNEQQSLTTITISPPPPSRHPLSSYRRLPLASLTPYTSLHSTCLVGLIRKVTLHGHTLQRTDPHSRIIQHQLHPTLLLDDGTALVALEVGLRCVERWADVLLRGEGCVLWVGGARVNETPSVGHGVRAGLRGLVAEYGYGSVRGLRVLRVDERSRYVMRAQHEQTLLTVTHAPHRITPLLSLLTPPSEGKPTARAHVHVKVLHVEWESDDSCVAWVSDSSLMPSATNASHPLPPTTVIVHLSYHLHIQQLRSFIHPPNEQSNSLLIRDLTVTTPPPTTTTTWPLHLTADTFTELCLPRPSDGATVPGFEQTLVYEQQRRQLRVVTRADPFDKGGHSVSMAEQLVPPFTPLPTRLSLSSLLTPTALHGYTASTLLQRYGLFDVEGVVMAVYPPALLSRQCGECGYLSGYEGGGRRSGGLQLSAYCRRCHCQSSEPHAVVGRVWVDVQCSDIHMLHTVRMLLSTGEVSRCLHGRLAVDGGAASVQSLLQDDAVVREQLLSKRVQCVCRCEEVREGSVSAQELQLVAMEPNKEWRARTQ